MFELPRLRRTAETVQKNHGWSGAGFDVMDLLTKDEHFFSKAALACEAKVVRLRRTVANAKMQSEFICYPC